MSTDIEQRTDEWFAQRIGKVTASRVSEVMAKTKSGYSASRKNYMAELVCERLTGQKAEGFTSSAIQWGIDKEPEARKMYEAKTFADVQESGFVEHPNIGMSGASPDGLVGDDGLIEIKCPLTATHLDTLTGAEIDNKYFCQMQFQMACTGRRWCDFVSFDPRLPGDLKIFIKRVERDDKFIAEMEKEIKSFLEELDAKLEKLKAMQGVA